MIGAIARALGIDTLVVYALLAALAAGGIWAWSAHQYDKGYSAGSAKERAAWVQQREEDQAKQLAKAAVDQRQIDQLETKYLAIQGQLTETQNALEEAIRADGADKKPALSKNVAKALNGVGR